MAERGIVGAVLLDRDGVINRERSDYVKSWAEFEFLPGVLTACRRLATLDCPILVVTNQSAIGRGLTSRESVDEIHDRMCQAVLAAGGRIDRVFLCPHHPASDCACRKPRPGLLEQAAQAYGLTLSECYFVGDAERDLLAAEASGCRPILVRSGLEAPRLADLGRSHPTLALVDDLELAAMLILTGGSS
jgi:D-glycero-D-manno-heptose 1,7-bisphosphate phosphatase